MTRNRRIIDWQRTNNSTLLDRNVCARCFAPIVEEVRDGYRVVYCTGEAEHDIKEWDDLISKSQAAHELGKSNEMMKRIIEAFGLAAEEGAQSGAGLHSVELTGALQDYTDDLYGKEEFEGYE